MGDLVKKTCLEPDSPFIKQVNEYFLKGVPQPDHIIEKILNKKIDSININRGIILDQFPLTVGQVDILDEIYKKFEFNNYCVCLIDVPKEKLMDRLLNRKTCPVCHRTYAPDQDEYKLNKCKCGAELTVRADDNQTAIVNRFKFNERLLAEVLKKFNDNEKLIKINGDQAVELVYEELKEKVKDFLKNN